MTAVMCKLEGSFSQTLEWQSCWILSLAKWRGSWGVGVGQGKEKPPRSQVLTCFPARLNYWTRTLRVYSLIVGGLVNTSVSNKGIFFQWTNFKGRNEQQKWSGVLIMVYLLHQCNCRSSEMIPSTIPSPSTSSSLLWIRLPRTSWGFYHLHQSSLGTESFCENCSYHPLDPKCNSPKILCSQTEHLEDLSFPK